MNRKLVIIEDEQDNIDVIHSLVTRFASDFEYAGNAGNVQEAIQLIESIQPDLVFLDIRLSDGTGFDVLRKFSKIDFQIIFITAYDNYSFDAIKFSAVDYLLKPVGFNEFDEAVTKARTRILEKQKYRNIEILLHNLSQVNELDKRLAVATIEGFEFINIKDIMWCGSEKGYTLFHLVNRQKVTSSRNLGYYEALLNHTGFCRIHHGIIINIQFVSKYIKGKGGCVIMEDGVTLEVSQRRKTDFLSRLSG